MSVHEEGAVHRKIAERLENKDLLAGIMAAREVFWLNENIKPVAEALRDIPLGPKDVQDAADRLERFRPYLASAFPETAAQGGLIESELRELKGLPEIMEQRSGRPFVGRLLMKLDSHLPISGSIKARGGIYEILKLAEAIALERGFLRMEEDYVKLDTPEARALFGEYSVAVGSTGNLGLSIGIIGAKFGFRVRVHMSADARTWKKELLREKGVTVIEHESDYSAAITEGRRQTEGDPKCHFVDDENSHDLFLGYSVVGERIRAQFEAMDIPVDRDHPLFTYLPCGVGGGPGGVAFGLKLAFGDDVHCFFAEPTHAPCMLLGLYSGMHEGISVRDLGLDVVTEADGLAVGRPSGFVGRTLRHLIDGAYTVDDAALFRWLTLVAQTESVKLEPSGLAGVPGALRVGACGAFGGAGLSANATHLVWATGGGMVPGEVWNAYDKEGRRLLSL